MRVALAAARRGPRTAARAVRAISAGCVARSSSESERRQADAGEAAGRPLRGVDRRGLRREVEQNGGDVDARHAVDQRVMRLLDQSDMTAVEPLDEPQLPQRAGPVEEPGLDARAQGEELLA